MWKLLGVRSCRSNEWSILHPSQKNEFVHFCSRSQLVLRLLWFWLWWYVSNNQWVVILEQSEHDLSVVCYKGGFPAAAWRYWVNTGIVSEKVGSFVFFPNFSCSQYSVISMSYVCCCIVAFQCSPYSLPSCDHHIPNSPNPCPPNEYPTPPCVKSCKDGKVLPFFSSNSSRFDTAVVLFLFFFFQSWQSDKHHGAKVYSVSGEEDIMQEIYTNGPVEVAFDV